MGIFIVEALLICLWGGIYDFSFAIYGIVVFGGLIYMAANRKIIIPLNITTYSLGIIFLGYIVSVFVAQDRGMALLGVLRWVVLMGFWVLWNNLESSSKRKIINNIPDIAVFLTVITILAYFIPSAKEYLYQANRMGGVFQYSNTYALFLLVAIVLIFYQEEQRYGKYGTYIKCIDLGILISGIVFCGSRSVMVLSVLLIIILIITEHGNRKLWISSLGITIGLTCVIQMIFHLDIQRLLKITLNSSTLNGRFLYWQDALKVLCKNPLGLGYMGYYFLQPQFQTGDYVTKFVHNDILQFGLDAGIFAAITLLVMIVVNILDKNNKKQNRIILMILFIHSVFDFDLQYSAMFCLLLMCMGEWAEKKYVLSRRRGNIVNGILAGICVYFSIALTLAHFCINESVLKMYPGNTLAREEFMLDKEEGADAEYIIANNGMLVSAYACAATAHIENGEYVEAYEDIQGVLKTAGYQITYYNQATYDLSLVLDQALKNNDTQNAQKILEEIQKIPEIINELEERTSSLAYKINDKPVFELDRQIQEYIESLSGVSLT